MLETMWENRLLNMAGHNVRPAARPLSISLSDNASLKDAYALCNGISKNHSKSFYLASSLLPAEKRSAVRALYAFCRTVDDIVDEGTVIGRDEELEYWKNIVKGIQHPRADDLTAQAWSDTQTRYNIPVQFALQLIDGVSRDLRQVNYQTFDDLTTYCYGVASTVGLMSMYIVGFNNERAVPYAIKLGVALQLTNILRDVGEDFRNNRLYLPLDELMEFNISIDEIQRGEVNGKWIKFMKFQVNRAREFYKEAAKGMTYLDHDGRLSIGAAADFYKGILKSIENNNYDVFSRRASLSKWDKIRQLPLIWLKLLDYS